MPRGQPRVRALQSVVPWTWRDVLAAYLCGHAAGLVLYVVGRILTGDRGVAIALGLYGGELVELCIPILWIQRRYGLGIEALGLKRGKLHPMTSVALGIGIAVAYYVVVRGWVFRTPISITASPSYLAAILTPLSFPGLASTVLTPLHEEVMYRGYLYACLRGPLGKQFALVVQAGLFSGLHFFTWYYGSLPRAIDLFLIGLMLGLLYEKTESLYAPIACHGIINYLAMLS